MTGAVTFERNSKLTRRLAIGIMMINVSDKITRLIGYPYSPNQFVKSGMLIHDMTVQYNINLNVHFTFPTALNKLVNGVEYDEKNAEMTMI